MDRKRRPHCMASILSRFESFEFLPLRTSNDLCVCSSCWQQGGALPLHCGCLSDYLHMPQHLWMDAAVSDETCQGVDWISWWTLWAHTINILFPAITHKLNISGHILIWTFFVLVYGTYAQTLSAPSSYTLYKSECTALAFLQIFSFHILTELSFRFLPLHG
jgi:hypothetical protein